MMILLRAIYALLICLKVFNIQILGKQEDALIKRVVAAQSRLPPYRISRDGSIMEWVCVDSEISLLTSSQNFLSDVLLDI